jgi:GT2 family glycosyltransferase
MTLTAVVLNWNTPALTVTCVRSLLDDGVPAERVVVVDNGSSDGSAARLAASLPGCRLVVLEENVGFARGTNAGAAALAADAYLLVNSDARVHAAGSVARLLDVLARDARAGVAVPRLRNEDLTVQQSVAPLSSPAVALVQATGLSRLVPNNRQPEWSTHWDHGADREVQAAAGAVMLVRGEAWSALGGFDETAFMYAEDRDLCWRARRLGWSVRFVAGAEFVHLGGASATTRWTAPARAERVGRAEAALVRRQHGRAAAAVTLGAIRTGLAARWAAATLLRRSDAAASFRGSLRGYSARDS